jgi:hypothetical protein
MEGMANWFRDKWAKEGTFEWLNYLLVGLLDT